MAESLADVTARLNVHRDAKATLYADVVKAYADGHGMNPHRIARESGLTRQGVVKILERAGVLVAPTASAAVDLAEAGERGIRDVPTREDGPL